MATLLPIPKTFGFKNLTGQKFNLLRVLGYVGRKWHTTAWLCRCDCGNETVACGQNLKNGSTTSCGCRLYTACKTHGLCKSPEYRVWASMRQRCNNPKESAYSYYGARGIKVCPEWDASFEAFIQDMGRRPSGGTLERIDNAKGYCKENCKWATQTEQMCNTRYTRKVTYQGRTQCGAHWAKELGMDQSYFHKLLRRGMSIEDILNRPNKR